MLVKPYYLSVRLVTRWLVIRPLWGLSYRTSYILAFWGFEKAKSLRLLVVVEFKYCHKHFLSSYNHYLLTRVKVIF